MDIIFSEQFKKEYKKIKDKQTRTKIIKSIKALADMPKKGKYLKNKFRGKQSLRITPFRLIYEVKESKMLIYCFDHRKKVYK